MGLTLSQELLGKTMHTRYVRIISRFDLNTGIGWHGWFFIQTLALVPHVQVEAVVTDDTISADVKRKLETMCNKVVMWNKVEGVSDISIYCDVLGQEPDRQCFKLGKINSCYGVFDSSRLPTHWVELCNEYFDLCIVPDDFVKDIFILSGIRRDVIVLPLAVKQLKASSPSSKRSKPCFGYAGSYEVRKNVDMLVEAFAEAFTEDEADLHVHIAYSHLAREKITQLKLRYAKKNIHFIEGHLNQKEFESFLEKLDGLISISGGEGYSLIPREFMHLGRPIMLSNSGAHKNIPPMEGLLFVEADIPFPAKYPQLDGGYHGYFKFPYKQDVVLALREMLKRAQRNEIYTELQAFAASFSVEKLAPQVATVLAPTSTLVSPMSIIYPEGCLGLQSIDLIKKYQHQGTIFNQEIVGRNKHIVLANDGGFFSVFNRLVSILAHELEENPKSLIVPDWRISAMKDFYGHDQFTSFCYGTPEDGNIFLKLFKPLNFDIPIESYNDPIFLRDKAEIRTDYNERKEPDLTYTHAYKLYKRKNFQQWREMYHKHFSNHIALRDELQEWIDEFTDKYFKGHYIIAAHVRHPSHSIEQPGGRIPTVEVFKEIIDARIEDAKKIQEKPVKVFIASDQDSVIRFFKDAYDDRLISVSATRTTDEHDEVFNNLSEGEKRKEGFQIQHIMASDKSRWSTKMADEVIIDTWLLAYSDVFVHITSNISTAVSFINPKVKMIYCE